MHYRSKQARTSSAPSEWPEYPDLRRDELCRRVFEQGLTYKSKDKRNVLQEFLRSNARFDGYRKGHLPPPGRVLQVIDVTKSLLDSHGPAKALIDAWQAARPDLVEAVDAYCRSHDIALRQQIGDGESHRWTDDTLAAHAASANEEAGGAFDALEFRLMLCLRTGCRRVDGSAGEITIPTTKSALGSSDAPGARASDSAVPVQAEGPHNDAEAVEAMSEDAASAPASTAVPLRRAMQRHDEALRRVRSEATLFRQLAEDESIASMPNALARLQHGVQEAIEAVHALVGATAYECDALATLIDEVPAPADRARMHRSLAQVRSAFDRARSERARGERQRGLAMLDELRGEVLSYARRRDDWTARITEAAAACAEMRRTAIEFGVQLMPAEEGEATPADDASMQELEEHLTRTRAATQKLDVLLKENVRSLLRARREECIARLSLVEAAAAQNVAAAQPLCRRLQRAVEQIDAAPRFDDLRTLLQDSAAAVAEADRLADELGVERAAQRVLAAPDWDGVWALVGSLWLKREFGTAFVVLAAALRAGHLPVQSCTAERLTQFHLRDALAFLGMDSAVVAANLMLDPFWSALVSKLPAGDSATAYLLMTAFLASGDARFNAGKLWQVSSSAEAVMLERMPRWFALGQRLMHGEAWRISEATDDHRVQLSEIEKAVREEFVRNAAGRYARVSAGGIANMLQIEQQKLLPDLEQLVDALFNASPGGEPWSRVVEKLDVAPEEMFDRYFGMLEESRHSHMRRSLLHRLTGFREKIKQYAVLRIAQQDYERRRPFLQKDLQEELDGAADLLGADVRALVHGSLMHRGANRASEGERHDGADSDFFGARIRAAMFDRSDVVRRLPRTAELVFSAADDARLSWDALFESIALDLSRPLTPDEMLPRFAEAGFYFAAESIAAEIGAAVLQDLQRERKTLEAQVDALLQRIAAPTDAMRGHRRKGCLRTLFVQLQQEISLQEELEREADAARRKTLSARLTKLKEDVRMLEDAIEQRNENADLPKQAVDALVRGLEAAREVHVRRLERGVDTAARIVEEIYHFLEFDGTSLAMVTQAIDRHLDEAAVAAKQGDRSAAPARAPVEEAAWLEELLGAGLTESQLAVRREAWENWQRMSRMQNRLDDGGVAGDEAVILESFARRLAEATRLMYAKSGSETLFALRPLAWFETRFQHPREALRRYRVRFLFVTGQVAKRDLRILEDHVRSQNFLDDDWLNVFVAPNAEGAAALQRWISQNRLLDTCSVLEERTVQEILKCKQNPTAAGRMCRLLLQAADPVHVEVFRFQNVVDADRDIFKGRAHEIKQIESGRGSFYIFGGRRIGKTSLLFAAEKQLRKVGAETAYASFEGHTDPQGLTVCRDVLRKLGVRHECATLDAFRELFAEHVLRVTAEKSEKSERREVVVFLDEVDRYITGCRTAGMRSHPLIHVLRALHQELHGKARFVMAGAIELWRQLKGRSDIPGAETPWANFATPIALGALNATDARAVVTAGFSEVLGIGLGEGVDRQIVENTTGHPAFVQFYCAKLHRRLHQRNEDYVSMEDVVAVYKDRQDDNFVMYARDTLSLNLGNLTRLGVYLLAIERRDRFNADDLARLAPGYQLPVDLPWVDCLDELQMTGVVRSEGGVYRFSVPTYPELLRQMEASLQDDVAQLIEKANAEYAAEANEKNGVKREERNGSHE